MSSTRLRWRSCGYVLTLLAVATAAVGCQGEPTRPGCHLVDGAVWITAVEGARADSVRRALSAVGLPYDTSAVRDCFTLYCEVTSGDPADMFRVLANATGANLAGVWQENQVFASLCNRDSSWAIQQASGIPDLNYDHIDWFAIETTVRVPVGQEDEWVLRLRGLTFVAEARRATWCPI